MYMCGGIECARCRLNGNSDDFRAEMHELLKSPSAGVDPTSRAEVVYDYWRMGMSECVAEDAYAEAWDVAVFGSLGFDASPWGKRELAIHLADEPIGLVCSPYGAMKLQEELYYVMKQLGIVRDGDHLDAISHGSAYLTANRLIAYIREGCGDNKRSRHAAAMVLTLAGTISRLRLPFSMAA